MPPALLIARAALLEARRTGLPWLALGLLAAALGLAAFLSQVALTEGRELQAAVVAALLDLDVYRALRRQGFDTDKAADRIAAVVNAWLERSADRDTTKD